MEIQEFLLFTTKPTPINQTKAMSTTGTGTSAPAATATPAAAAAPAATATGTPAAGRRRPQAAAAAAAAPAAATASVTPRVRRTQAAAAPATTHIDDDDDEQSTAMKVLKWAGIAILVLILLLILIFGCIFAAKGVKWAMNSFPSTPAPASEVGSDGLTEGQRKAQALAGATNNGSASTAPAAVEKELANGEHIGGGREFVKTQNGFGLLCFKNNRQICWMNEGDDITAGNPGEGVTVLKVNRKEVERHGIAVKGETTEGSFTFVAVPNATVKTWRTVK